MTTSTKRELQVREIVWYARNCGSTICEVTIAKFGRKWVHFTNGDKCWLAYAIGDSLYWTQADHAKRLADFKKLRLASLPR